MRRQRYHPIITAFVTAAVLAWAAGKVAGFLEAPVFWVVLVGVILGSVLSARGRGRA